jgi:2-methylcitrate dehydratase PrpD
MSEQAKSLYRDTIAFQLARYVKSLKYDDLPADVINQTKLLVLDQLGVELIGSTLQWTQPALKLIQHAPSTKEESTVINHGIKTVAWDAALVNATFGQGCELDDMAFGSAGHIGTATIPVALAMGEREHSDGKDFVTSIVAGYEVMYRLMTSVQPHHAVRGFQSQGIGGPYAAAAVAGKMLSLSENEMVNAFGIAGSHSSGSLEYDQSGGEVKRLHAGLAARGGIQSAILAQYGLTGPATIIEGKRGFCHIFSDHSNADLIVKDLGQTFNIRQAWIKMYPAVATIHTAIAAVADLTEKHQLTPEDVEEIKVGIAEHSLLHGAAIYQPTDVASAQFSLGFSIALTIARRSNDLSLYMDPSQWTDENIIALAHKVQAYAHPEARGEKRAMAVVDLKCVDGRVLQAVQHYPNGSPRNPAPEEAIYRKFRTLAASVLEQPRIDKLIHQLAAVEELDDIAKLLPHSLANVRSKAE